MSYNNYAPPNNGYPNQSYSNQGYSQQTQNYGNPPPQMQQGGSYPQQGYAPQGNFAPVAGSNFGAPQAAYGAQQGYGAPVQQNHNAYPQQGYGPPQTSQQSYSAPQPIQQGYGAPQQGYGAPPPQQSQAWVPPAAPFDPSYNADADIAAIRKATKGFGTNEDAITQIITKHSPAHAIQLCERFEQMVGKSLELVLEKETSGWYRFGAIGCAIGPLAWDVALLHRAMKGMGTHEDLLTELLIGRSNGEINELKYAYEQKYHKSLQQAVQGELSMKTERMFNMALTARRDEEYAPIDPGRVQADIQTLYNSSSKRLGTDEIAVCGIILSRSDNHLRAVAQGYAATHRKTVPEMIRAEFSGHMKDALLHAIDGAIDRPSRDANLLEASMAGLGTKDERLTYRVVRMHWDKQHVASVKAAFRHIYGKDLISRVKGETSGAYERLLVACLV